MCSFENEAKRSKNQSEFREYAPREKGAKKKKLKLSLPLKD
jgi:hypothetical protein